VARVLLNVSQVYVSFGHLFLVSIWHLWECSNQLHKAKIGLNEFHKWTWNALVERESCCQHLVGKFSLFSQYVPLLSSTAFNLFRIELKQFIPSQSDHSKPKVFFWSLHCIQSVFFLFLKIISIWVSFPRTLFPCFATSTVG